MTVLLSYSMNLSANSLDTIPSTGGVKQDSILIAYSDLRKVNAKLIELEYEKEINEHLRTIIDNDSIAIDGLRSRISRLDNDYRRDIQKVKRERNTLFGVSIGSILLLVLSLL